MIGKIAFRSLINRHSFFTKKILWNWHWVISGKKEYNYYSDDNLPDIGKALSATYFFCVTLSTIWGSSHGCYGYYHKEIEGVRLNENNHSQLCLGWFNLINSSVKCVMQDVVRRCEPVTWLRLDEMEHYQSNCILPHALRVLHVNPFKFSKTDPAEVSLSICVYMRQTFPNCYMILAV